MISSACFDSLLDRLVETSPCRAALTSVAIEHPPLGQKEVEPGQRGDDEQESPGHRGGVAHVEGAEAALVEIERVEQGRVGWTALPAADHERLGEALERADHLQDEVEED